MNPPDASAAANVSGASLSDDALQALSAMSSDLQLQLAVDLGRIVIWRHDLQTGRIHYNQHGFSMLGREPLPEGLSIEELRALIHPDDLPLALATAERALHTDGPVDMQARYRRPEGGWRHMMTRRVLRRGSQGEALEFLGVALDLSEQVEKTRQTAELASRLELTAAAAELGVWSHDLHTLQGTWNAQMYRLFDRDPSLGPAMREQWLQYIHADDRERLAASSAQLLAAGGQTLEHEYRVLHRNGSVRWVVQRARHEGSAGPSMIFGVSFDVTERVRTEAALRRANEQVALTTQSVGLGIWEWNAVSGETSWDASMYRLRGIAPRAVAPDAAERLNLVHPDDRPRIGTELAAAARSNRPIAYEFRVVWPDGRVRWLASRTTPVADADASAARFIGVNWDITEQVEAGEARQAQQLAERQSRATAEFLARMSHELRTPLNAVLGFAQLLQRDTPEAASVQQKRIQHIVDAGEHLLSLINDVLDLSNLDGPGMKLDTAAVTMSSLVREALPLVEALAQAGAVSVQVGMLDGVVRTDRRRLRQVLVNLLSNAIKYNHAGGTVHIASHIDADTVRLCVADNGRGMDADQVHQVFEPFNRLGMELEGIEGTGIGLAIVKALVQRMAGRVNVSSERGRGSVFTITLPCEPGKASQPTAPSPQGVAPSVAEPRRGKLLYIEDNPVNVMLVEELIANQPGLSIVSETTGTLGVARALSLQPDLVLIDMQLPDFDGFEVLRRLRLDPRTAALRCVAVSANVMPEDIARALAAGFADYWTKPLDFAAFLAALEAILPANPAVDAA